MLLSLAACGPHNYHAFARCEPGCDRSSALIKHYLPKAHVHVNRKKLGIRENPYQVLTDAFQADSYYNLYLEEDIVLSPDALALSDWYFLNPPAKSTLCLNLLNYKSDRTRPADVLLTNNEFNALGLGIRRQSWRDNFQPVWFVDEPGDRTRGWDWSVHRLLARSPELFTVQPALSRSNHTGRSGTYCRPAFHDETFGQLAVNANPGPLEYRYVE